jgi:hypothetical protein
MSGSVKPHPAIVFVVVLFSSNQNHVISTEGGAFAAAVESHVFVFGLSSHPADIQLFTSASFRKRGKIPVKPQNQPT